MNIHLTTELAQLVQTKVKSGRYNSASEVVREALRLLEERDQLLELRKEAIRQQIDAGWESLRRGRRRWRDVLCRAGAHRTGPH